MTNLRKLSITGMAVTQGKNGKRTMDNVTTRRVKINIEDLFYGWMFIASGTAASKEADGERTVKTQPR